MAVLETLANRLIPSGTTETPDVVVPADVNALTLIMSRENWPAAGVTIAIAVSTDAGQTWKWWNQFIAPFVPTAKTTNVADAPAKISYGWNPNLAEKRANRVRVRVVSPQSFRSDIQIEGHQLVL